MKGVAVPGQVVHEKGMSESRGAQPPGLGERWPFLSHGGALAAGWVLDGTERESAALESFPVASLVSP